MNSEELENRLNQMGLLVDKLKEWAHSRPEKPFMYYGEEDRTLSYGEFNRLANCVANNLRSMGASKGDRVSLFLKNPLVTTLAMYGIWKIGAVFCPINFLYQGRLLSYQINDTKPKLLITENGREPVLNRIQPEIEDLPVVIHRPKPGEHDYSRDKSGQKLDGAFKQTSFDELLQGDRTDPDVELHYWDTANIVYTSGTTGPPKGVVQSYRWLQNYCYYGVKLLHPDDVVYCDLPLYHVGGAFALVGRAAWRGCSVAVWDRFSPSDFWNRVQKSGASYCLLLDVMMPRLLQAEPTSEDRYNTPR
ncbi:MAG: acyl--CoA ligase [Deltaproteobacteria bacterium]|nr:acyl--CoA ligase [Deltaproteobacteria bacterium]MBW2008781.1 acyl--CoA ligase [Deltaproteobacteria bacterium]